MENNMFGKFWPAFRRREMRKGKVIHVLALKAYGGMYVWFHALLTLPFRQGWLVSFTSLLLYPIERSSNKHSVRVWMGCWASLDALEGKTFHAFAGKLNMINGDKWAHNFSRKILWKVIFGWIGLNLVDYISC